jgi:beta-glucosidase
LGTLGKGAAAAATGAAFGSVGCLVPHPNVADVPSARRAGVPAPDLEALLARMTLDEKIGQMTQADRSALLDGSEINTSLLGSVLNGGDSLPVPNRPGVWADMTDAYQSQALSTRLGIPLLYGVDAVHGHGGVRGATVFPHNIGLGCTRDPALVTAAARVTAREVSGTGIDWTFAPCVAVPRDERWGRTYEGFGETPELAATLGAAAIHGFQEASDGTAILACAKHFLGDGGTTRGKDQGDTRVSDEELRRIHLPGYVDAVKAGVATVMVSYSSVNGQPMHGSRPLITDVLKGELGFSGFVVTDWQAIDKMPGDYPHDIETAINAGIDMVMVPIRFPEFIRTLKQLVGAGRVPMARIDDAVRRILRQKARFRLWERPFCDRTLTPLIGSAPHRAVARQAVRQSVVVLKNDAGTLPLRPDARVRLVGAKGDDLGSQCGGWTVGWQGRRGETTDGTTIRQAIAAVVGTSRLDFSEDASGAGAADVVVVVVGEDPYAEGKGDRARPSLSAADQALVTTARQSGKPVVVVLIVGRPVILGAALDDASALVCAWLPGTEGAGIADVLFGVVPATGQLSCSWPRGEGDIPVNVGDPNYQPLFPYGHGIRT